ncbi:MAG: serine hydrolase domain-containing protein [Arenicella sp.]
MVLSIIVLLVVTGVVVFFGLKYWLNTISDKHDLQGSIEVEVSKFTRKGLSHALVVGVYKEGKHVFRGYGNTTADNPVVPDSLTSFQIGSVSKVFTSALLQIMVDEGVVSMESTLQELIGEQYTLSPEASQVTLKQLATHTSGFPRVPASLLKKVEGIVGKSGMMENPYSYIELADVMNYLEESKGKRRPGRLDYSNYGMGLLGHVLEIVSGKDLQTLTHEKIFEPLSMQATSIQLTETMQESLAQGYSAQGESAPLWTFSALGGAGAFNSNVSDMMKFIIANIEGKSSLSSSFEVMQEPSDVPGIGIGWMQPSRIDRFFGNISHVWHNGMVGGYTSYIAVDRHTQTGVVVLSSKSIDVSMLGMMLVRQARTQSWSSPESSIKSLE